MTRSFRINLGSPITPEKTNNVERFFAVLSTYDGIEVNKEKLEISYDLSLENEIGNLLDKYLLFK